jgi:hypothetical protein
MRNAMKIVAGAARARTGVLAGLITVAAAAAALPARVSGAVEGVGTVWRECVDEALLDYNGCLMESENWFHRKICDLAFELDVVACTAKAIGEIRNSWNGN